jgi:hypothetical protein
MISNAGQAVWYTEAGCSGGGSEYGFEVSQLIATLEILNGTTGLIELTFHSAGTVPQYYESFWAGESAYWDCEGPAQFAHVGDSELSSAQVWFGAFTGGTCTLILGDVDNPDASCPGGDPIYTDTDLSAYVGGVVQLDDDVWYSVAEDTEGNSSDGEVTVVDDADSCAEVC